MKKTVLFAAALLISLFGLSQKEYTIKAKIEGNTNKVAYLASYSGKNLFYYDTTDVKSDGSFTFKNTDMPHGVYAIIVSMPPSTLYFDILVNETNIDLRAKMPDPVGTMNVRKSEENKIFFNYISYLKKQSEKKKPLIEKASEAQKNNKKEELEKINSVITEIDKGVLALQKEIANKHKDKLVGKLVNMSVEIDIPEPTQKVKDTAQYKYDYYIEHYWDNIDITDDRLGKSALFYNKMENYFMKVIPQAPDTIIKRIDQFLSKVEQGGVMWKSSIEFLIYAHIKTKMMGMDAVYVHMADNYILNGKCDDWIDKDKIDKIRPKVNKMRPTLIGKTAPNIILADSTEKNWINLKTVKSKYTMLIFWADDCGHCQKEIPKFNEIYDSIKKNTNIDLEVYAVCTSISNTGWKKFINKHDLSWINVSDFQDMRDNPEKYILNGNTTLKSINYRNSYDVFVTPIAYLLDENKKIIAKQFGSDQFKHILEVTVNNNL
ncbi:MAG: redoxin domain-containing protein [Flavobacteriales bacterium]